MGKKKAATIGMKINSYYDELLRTIYNYFHPPEEDSDLFFVRLIRSKDEVFALNVQKGFRNYNHFMAFRFYDNTRSIDSRRELQMNYFKIAFDFFWLLGIKPPKPPKKVTEIFPDLKLLRTKKGRLTYALRESHEKTVRKTELIKKLLDYEYAIPENASREEQERMDVERQVFASRMGWPNMTIEDLELQVSKLYK